MPTQLPPVGARVKLRGGVYTVIHRGRDNETGGALWTDKRYPWSFYGTVTALKDDECVEVKPDGENYWTLCYVWSENIIEICNTVGQNP